ncbi:SDR family oxidoreductase [Streptomyces sp. NEAU-sy36]|uniref:SDR family oxidoreductase n=1 Tax=unclassified Streptomyces TaxID=2593676 RepID=UPI0015D5E4CE|nr:MULTISPECIES: SDR family oxidoreductase [unclassified Streptomyces]QLJ02246.1 SDR family oxidoreductase [Streptomyces sp. NEAU-sy36]
MRVFVTGASGWIGSAVVPELLDAGHQVVGLARSDASAAALTAAGAEVVRGSLDDLEVLASAAADSDGVIHLAFKHDIAFSGEFRSAAEADRRAVDTLTGALAGSDRPFVIASGVAGLKPGQVSTERDRPKVEGDSPVLIRAITAEAVLACAERGVRSCVVRLAPTCHGEGDHGFVAGLIGIAREKGASGYVGDGANRWPAVHRLDAARLFRLAVEKAPAGTVLHGIAEEGVPIREVAEVIGRHLGVPTVSVGAEDAAAHFGWMSGFAAVDAPASNDLTRELLGWEPTRPGLLADLEEGHYFRAPAGSTV